LRQKKEEIGIMESWNDGMVEWWNNENHCYELRVTGHENIVGRRQWPVSSDLRKSYK
jgi:hypothetical protein